MSRGVIYFDNAATSWPKPAGVAEAMGEFLAHSAGNPGRGAHRLARRAVAVVDEARAAVAKLVHADAENRVVLTHGCTDAVCLAIHGRLEAFRCPDAPKPHAVMSSIEHNAVARTLHSYEARGVIDLDIVRCDEIGRIDPSEFLDACNERTTLAALSHASNATGTIQAVGEIGRGLRSKCPSAVFMVDAAQTAGAVEIDVVRDAIDLLTIAGHKGLLGPTGTGGLYVGPRAHSGDDGGPKLFCSRAGGTGAKAPGLEMPCVLPDALESGTANAVGLAGLLAGMRADVDHANETAMTGLVLDGLASIAGVTLHGLPTTEGRTHSVLFSIEGVDPRAAAEHLDREHSIAVRGGTHCAPLLHDTIGTAPAGAVRASPGPMTTREEVERLIGAIASIVKHGVASSV